jgi:hypothetical protein
MKYLLLLILAAGCGRLWFEEVGGDEMGEPLTIEAPARINLNTTVPVTVTGGAPPYGLAIIEGTGELDGELFRSAAHAGYAVVEVRDGFGDTASAQIRFGGDYLYAAGGSITMAAIDSVWRSEDGAQWQLVGTLPIPRSGGMLVVYEDQLLYIGGATMSDGTPGDHVFASRDGVTWTQLGTLPETREIPAAAVYRGRLYVGGGIRTPAAAYTNNVWSSADGVTWQPEPSLPAQIHGHVFVPWRDQLLSVAGHEASGQVDAIHAFNGTSWRRLGAVPVAGEYHATAVIGDELWIAGGLGLLDRVVRTSDGVGFVDAAPMPQQRNWGGMFWHRDEIWIVSGVPAQPLHSSDGGAWTAAGAPPATNLDATGIAQFTPP